LKNGGRIICNGIPLVLNTRQTAPITDRKLLTREQSLCGVIQQSVTTPRSRSKSNKCHRYIHSFTLLSNGMPACLPAYPLTETHVACLPACQVHP
jgi:hypothetical protein